MILLVTGSNYLVMFVGWEGVGVCSYLLVNFWFTRSYANQSSISAFITNRVGDMFLTVGMFTVVWSFGNLDYATVFSLAPFINEDIIVLIGICLLIGAMAKSSQLGLQERTSMPKRVNNVEFTLYSTLLIAGNFSNAW